MWLSSRDARGTLLPTAHPPGPTQRPERSREPHPLPASVHCRSSSHKSSSPRSCCWPLCPGGPGGPHSPSHTQTDCSLRAGQEQVRMPHRPTRVPSAPAAWALVPARHVSPSATSHHGQSQAEARAPWRLIRCFVWAWDKGAQGQPASCRGRGGGWDQPPGRGRAAWPEPVGTGAGSTRGRHSCSRTTWLSCPHCPSLALTGLLLDPSQPLGLTLSLSSAQGPSGTWETLVPQMARTKDASSGPRHGETNGLASRTQPAGQGSRQGTTGPSLNRGPSQGREGLRDWNWRTRLRPLLWAGP